MDSPKQKFALKISPEILRMVEKNYKEDGCGCRSAFIEKAILFYCGYLTANDYREYFPNVIVSTTKGKDVLDSFTYRGLIYESAKYHNVVFVGKDKDGKPRHAHKRGSGSQSTYKGNAPGSLPGYSFHWVGASDRLYLFEAPVDLLSYISMHKSGWRNHSYAASCSVSDKVLWQMLHDCPYIKQVFLCFDSDNAGKEAAKRIAKKLKQQNIECEILVPVGKDWNEDLTI